MKGSCEFLTYSTAQVHQHSADWMKVDSSKVCLILFVFMTISPVAFMLPYLSCCLVFSHCYCAFINTPALQTYHAQCAEDGEFYLKITIAKLYQHNNTTQLVILPKFPVVNPAHELTEIN